MERVHSFLALLPQGYPAQIEFRHQDWFTESTFKEVIDAMKNRQIGAVITDVALRRDALHMCLTTTTAFVRFNGYGLHPSDFTRLDAWIGRLKQWLEKGVERIYFFMHQENEAHTIRLCDYFINQVNQHLGLNLPPLNLEK